MKKMNSKMSKVKQISINTVLLIILLGVLLVGNLTESVAYENRGSNDKKVLLELNLNGIDFIKNVSSEAFEIIEVSEYSYALFKTSVFTLGAVILGLLIFQFFDKTNVMTPVSFTLLIIVVFIFGGIITQYPNYFFELCDSKFFGINKTIDSKTPGVLFIISIATVGFVFNWTNYFIAKKRLNSTK